MKKVIPLAMALLLLTHAASAEDITYGEDLKKFVDHAAYPLSKNMAVMELAKRWQLGFQDGIQMFQARKSLIVDAAAGLEIPALKSNLTLDEATEILKKSNRNIELLSNLEQVLDRSKIQLSNLTGACESEFYFSQTGMDQLGNLVLGVGMPADPSAIYKVEIVGDFVSQVMDSIGDLFSFLGTSNAKKQKNLAEEAVQTLPQKLVQKREVFEISKKLCAGTIEFFKADLDGRDESVEAIRDLLTKKRNAFYAIRKVAEAKIVQANLEEASKSSGYTALLAEINANDFVGTVMLDSVRAVEALRTIKRHAENATPCVALLHEIEQFHDAAGELGAVYSVLSQRVHTPALVRRIRQDNETNAQLFSDFAKQEKHLKEICK